uniref:F-box domain-containing protein n=1 Tax=Oryza barthii TaxID=65489 RepID=A0A0D3GGY4_9ORYZ
MAGGNKKVKKAMETIATNINDLPNEVLQYILSFLSTREVVQTCVLSQRWCNIWKFVPTVHVTNETIQHCQKLLDHVIMQRGDVSINTCHLEFVKYFRRENRKANKWIFHALSVCKVKELRVYIQFQDFFLTITNQAIISGYLRKLELDSVKLEANSLDFTSCPLLEELQMGYCIIYARKIVSKSLKRLKMETMFFETEDDDGWPCRLHISVPNIVSLTLLGFDGWTPLFENTPYLAFAIVTFNDECYDTCQYSSFWDCGNEDCEGCYAIGDHLNGSVFLHHLSHTTHMELTNDCRMNMNDSISTIFDRDLKWCPLFRNLKTLLLNEWFLENGLRGVLRILQHSPALEKITLKLYMEPKKIVESEESYGTMEQPFVMNHLKKISVKCQKEVMWVKKIIMTLTQFGIPHQRICVKEIPRSSIYWN